VLTSVHLPNSKASHLLAGRSKLSHLLRSGVELLGQPSKQLRLFVKAVLGILLAIEELRFLLAACHKRLQTTQVKTTKKGEIKTRSTDMLYLANRVDDIAQ
jgi:hypothetical protein